MKKILPFLCMFFAFHCFSQSVQWGDFYKIKDGKASCEYIGAIDATDYYVYGILPLQDGNIKFTHGGFAAFNGTEMTAQSKRTPAIPKQGAGYIGVTSKDVIVISEEYPKMFSRDKEITVHRFDKTTLEEKTPEVLITLTQNNSVSYIASSDKSKLLIACMLYEDRKKNGGYMVMYMYDKDLNLLWQKEYKNTADADMFVRNTYVTDKGDVYMLCSYYENSTEKKDKRESLLLVYNSEHSQFARVIETDQIIDEACVYPIDEDKVFIALGNKVRLDAITYSYKDASVINRASFTYKTNNNGEGSDKVFTEWQISQLLPLDNGNIAVVVSDKLISNTYVNGIPSMCYIYDANLYVVSIDPLNTKPDYAALLTRHTYYKAKGFLEYADYDKPLVFAYNNNVYAVYNMDIRQDERSSELYFNKGADLNKPQSKNTAAHLMKITPDGNVKVTHLLNAKEDKRMLSTIMSHQLDNGKILLGSRNGNKLSLSVFELK